MYLALWFLYCENVPLTLWFMYLLNNEMSADSYLQHVSLSDILIVIVVIIVIDHYHVQYDW